MTPRLQRPPLLWRPHWAAALLLLGTVGCPHAFGRSGNVERAAHQDAMKGVHSYQGECPPAGQDLEEFCEDQPNPEECILECSK